MLVLLVVAILSLSIPIPLTTSATTHQQEESSSNAQNELVLVQALWRHGDRSPTTTFKTDKYQENAWPQGWGQLTPRGMAQHVQLGKKLRKRYITDLKFVNSHYKNHEIYVRSTDVNRTLISAISNLIGFYGPGSGEDYPKDLGEDWPAWYTPIAVHTVSGREDFIAPGAADCKRHDAVMDMIRETREYQETIEKYKWMLDVVAKESGEPLLDNSMDIWLVADAFFIEQLNNMTLVEWADGNKTLLDAIDELDRFQTKWLDGIGLSPAKGVNFAEELPRMRGGPILWKMITNMRDKLVCHQQMVHLQKAGMEVEEVEEPVEIKGKKSPLGGHLCKWINRMRYFVYSAHDSTIAALFSTLGFAHPNYDTDDFPHYSACITVELWRNNAANGTLSVKVLYWRPEDPDALDITKDISGCEQPEQGGCPLEQFVERSRPYQMLPSPEEYCKKPLAGDEEPTNSAWPAPMISGNGNNILILLLTAFLIFVCLRPVF